MSVFREPEATTETRRAWWHDRRVIMAVGIILPLLAIILIWRSCRGGAAQPEGNIVVSVQVAKAERGTIANEISSVAGLVPRREATITPKIAAQIKQMGLV